ncbi:MAG TPA: hypothetical protein VFV72_05255 [Candidatus Limnocylindrales bacterium]|nr:hypothetical protein [Candidatus Limnocylindrales bacterium]
MSDVVEDVADDPAGDSADRDRLRQLPGHEIDDDATVGGGVMSEGGTAVDRGTGTLTGQAEGMPPDDNDPLSGPDDEPDEVMPSPLSQE